VTGDPSDDGLMARGAAGDHEAFRLLVARWERPVHAFLYRMVGSAEEAQDLGQETFLRVCAGAARYRAEGRFRSWLFRIAGNLARSHLRRRRVLQWLRFDPRQHDREARAPGPERQVERAEACRTLREALARLPHRQRQAVILQHYEGMSYDEIAAAMGTSVSAVHSLLHRGMLGLRRELRELED
jgi:RNA polymerase sigma factor (sigma-70 family)